MDLPVLRGPRVVLRPLAEEDLDAMTAIVRSPEVREWWPGHAAPDEELREELRNEGGAFAITVEGDVAGWLGVWEEGDPHYRHAGLDIVLGAAHQDAGLGPESLRAAIAWLVAERGHHRITIDPALANARAIRAYEKAGFRRVGVMRRYERGPDGEWRDSLLLDLLAEELGGGATGG